MISGNINSTYFSVYTYGGEMIISSPRYYHISWANTWQSTITGTIYYSSISEDITSYMSAFYGAISFIDNGYCPAVAFASSCNFDQVYTDFTETKLTNLSGSSVGMFTSCVSLSYAYLSSCSIISPLTFYNCSHLLTVYLPVCTSIGYSAFYNTELYDTNFSSLYVDLPICSYIDECAFSNSRLRVISIPVCEFIGSSAFIQCSLQSISLPMCSYIGEDAFAACTRLSYVDLHSCTYIGSYAFGWCDSLKSFIIRTSNCSLGYDVFNNTPIASSQGGIYVPSSLVSVYKTATNWSSLSNNIYPISE